MGRGLFAPHMAGSLALRLWGHRQGSRVSSIGLSRQPLSYAGLSRAVLLFYSEEDVYLFRDIRFLCLGC